MTGRELEGLSYKELDNLEPQFYNGIAAAKNQNNQKLPTIKCYLLYAFNLKPRVLAMKRKNKSVKRRMPYDFEMECKTMAVSKNPNLEIGNSFHHPSSTDVGRCGPGFPLNMHESSLSEHMDVMLTIVILTVINLLSATFRVVYTYTYFCYISMASLVTFVFDADEYVEDSVVHIDSLPSSLSETLSQNVLCLKTQAQHCAALTSSDNQGCKSGMGSSLHSRRSLCIDMAINNLFFHVQDGDDRHGRSKDADYVLEKLHRYICFFYTYCAVVVFIGSALLALQQFSGINAISYFSLTVFKSVTCMLHL
nr:hypothetical protein [Tanacetum cinerariifolium]